MSDTIAFWQGDFGRDYLTRNQVDYTERIPLLNHIAEIILQRLLILLKREFN